MSVSDPKLQNKEKIKKYVNLKITNLNDLIINFKRENKIIKERNKIEKILLTCINNYLTYKHKFKLKTQITHFNQFRKKGALSFLQIYESTKEITKLNFQEYCQIIQQLLTQNLIKFRTDKEEVFKQTILNKISYLHPNNPQEIFIGNKIPLIWFTSKGADEDKKYLSSILIKLNKTKEIGFFNYSEDLFERFHLNKIFWDPSRKGSPKKIRYYFPTPLRAQIMNKLDKIHKKSAPFLTAVNNNLIKTNLKVIDIFLNIICAELFFVNKTSSIKRQLNDLTEQSTFLKNCLGELYKKRKFQYLIQRENFNMHLLNYYLKDLKKISILKNDELLAAKLRMFNREINFFALFEAQFTEIYEIIKKDMGLRNYF
ncbi:hypothetical protein HN587_07025 [Candidatus Woesearchaeota archaeon]|jgi:hypothetical protein|nr:hypothetical protein [Candidatus Woesearchaeota archaeon]